MKRKEVIQSKERLGRKMDKALRRWTQLVDRYCHGRWKSDQDNPYWHSERGSVGLLAAAIWSTGGLAIEEHPAEMTEGRKTKPVRLDLWCCLGGEDYAFEAKQRHIMLSTRTTPAEVKKRVQSALRDAVGNAKRKPGYGRRAGIVFAVPYANGTRRNEPEELGRLLRKFVDGLGLCKASFVAWCFQPKGHRTWSYWPRDGHNEYYFWPGIAVLGRSLRKRK